MQDCRPGARGHAVWGAGGCCFASLTAGCWGGRAVWSAGGCCLASLTAGCCARGHAVGVLLDAVWRAFRPGAEGYAVWGAGGGDGRALERMQFAVLVQVVWDTVRGASRRI